MIGFPFQSEPVTQQRGMFLPLQLYAATKWRLRKLFTCLQWVCLQWLRFRFEVNQQSGGNACDPSLKDSTRSGSLLEELLSTRCPAPGYVAGNYHQHLTHAPKLLILTALAVPDHQYPHTACLVHSSCQSMYACLCMSPLQATWPAPSPAA
jgi:hypothetical protein